MKQHFYPAEQSIITYQGKCNWCGESEGSMNEIIEMAREAGFHISPIDSVLLPKLEAFYKLAVAKEREACAKVCEEIFYDWYKVSDEYDDVPSPEFCAKAIRARAGEQK